MLLKIEPHIPSKKTGCGMKNALILQELFGFSALAKSFKFFKKIPANPGITTPPHPTNASCITLLGPLINSTTYAKILVHLRCILFSVFVLFLGLLCQQFFFFFHVQKQHKVVYVQIRRTWDSMLLYSLINSEAFVLNSS